MKRIILIVIAVTLFDVVVGAVANSETLRCEGSIVNSRNDFEKRITIYIDVAIPEKGTEGYILALTDKNAGNFKELLSPTPLVKKGSIAISTSLDKCGKQRPKRYDLIITKMPDKNNSLVGFVYGFSPWILKVDTWKQSKPFTFFQTGSGNLIQGECECKQH